MEEQAQFKVGDRVEKVSGYGFPGIVASIDAYDPELINVMIDPTVPSVQGVVGMRHTYRRKQLRLREAQPAGSDLETLQAVNEIARTFGFGQGELDDDLAGCLRRGIERMDERLAEVDRLKDQLASNDELYIAAQTALAAKTRKLAELRAALQHIASGECNCRQYPELCNCASRIADAALEARPE